MTPLSSKCLLRTKGKSKMTSQSSRHLCSKCYLLELDKIQIFTDMASTGEIFLKVSLLNEAKAHDYFKSTCFKHIFSETNYLANFWVDIICNWHTGESKANIAAQYEMLEWLRIMVEAGKLVAPFNELPEARAKGAQPPILFDLYSRASVRSSLLNELAKDDPSLRLSVLRQREKQITMPTGSDARQVLIEHLDTPIETCATHTEDVQCVTEDKTASGQGKVTVRNEVRDKRVVTIAQ